MERDVPPGDTAGRSALPTRRGYYVYVTEACNLRCSYCFVKEKHNGRHLTREMAGNVFRFITGEAASLTDLYVHFFGGEPLLQPAMVDYLASELRAWCKDRPIKLRLGITTNGTLLTPSNCEMLTRHGVGVQLSLDGSQRGNDVHRQVMGGTQCGLPFAGAFERVRIADYFVHFGKQRPNCRMTLTVENLPYLSQSIRELHELGFRSFSIIPDADCGAWTPDCLSRYEAEVGKVFEYWAQHREIGVNLIDQTIRKLTVRSVRGHLCRASSTVLGITIDGDIYPCHDFAGRFAADPVERERLLMGNVETGYLPNPREFEDLTVGPDVKSGNGYDCNACWAKWVCARGCPYMNYAHSGEIRRVNATYCATSRINTSLALRWMSILDDYRFFDVKAERARPGRRLRSPSIRDGSPVSGPLDWEGGKPRMPAPIHARASAPGIVGNVMKGEGL